MNVMELDDFEYGEALFDAFREKNIHPDEYRPFWDSAEARHRSIAMFRTAIDRIKMQIDEHNLVGEREPEWLVRARAAKRHYEREVTRINQVTANISRARRKRARSENNARFTEWSAKMHALLEQVCIDFENMGGDLSVYALPNNDPEGEPMPLDKWLDVREEIRAKKAARNG